MKNNTRAGARDRGAGAVHHPKGWQKVAGGQRPPERMAKEVTTLKQLCFYPFRNFFFNPAKNLLFQKGF